MAAPSERSGIPSSSTNDETHRSCECNCFDRCRGYARTVLNLPARHPAEPGQGTEDPCRTHAFGIRCVLRCPRHFSSRVVLKTRSVGMASLVGTDSARTCSAVCRYVSCRTADSQRLNVPRLLGTVKRLAGAHHSRAIRKKPWWGGADNSLLDKILCRHSCAAKPFAPRRIRAIFWPPACDGIPRGGSRGPDSGHYRSCDGDAETRMTAGASDAAGRRAGTRAMGSARVLEKQKKPTGRAIRGLQMSASSCCPRQPSPKD